MPFTHQRGCGSPCNGTSRVIGSIVHGAWRSHSPASPWAQMFTVDMPPGLPLIAEGLKGHQLDGRVRQAEPRAALRGGYGVSMKLVVEGFTLGEHCVHDGREFFRNQRAGNRFAFPPLPPLELGLHFGKYRIARMAA